MAEAADDASSAPRQQEGDEQAGLTALPNNIVEAVLLFLPSLRDIARVAAVCRELHVAGADALRRVDAIHLVGSKQKGISSSKSACGSTAALDWALRSGLPGLRHLCLEDALNGDRLLQLLAFSGTAVPKLELLSVARAQLTTDVGANLLLDSLNSGRLPCLRLLDCSETAVSFEAVKRARSLAPHLAIQRIPSWFAKTWLNVCHSGAISEGEAHTYFLDGSFKFARDTANAGVVRSWRTLATHSELILSLWQAPTVLDPDAGGQEIPSSRRTALCVRPERGGTHMGTAELMWQDGAGIFPLDGVFPEAAVPGQMWRGLWADSEAPPRSETAEGDTAAAGAVEAQGVGDDAVGADAGGGGVAEGAEAAAALLDGEQALPQEQELVPFNLAAAPAGAEEEEAEAA